MEEQLGVRLLTRTTRSVSLTDAGERLRQSVASHFEGIDEALAALTELRDKPAGTIRITTGDHAAETILWPIVEKLLPEYPDIKVEIIVARTVRFDRRAKPPFRSRILFGKLAHHRLLNTLWEISSANMAIPTTSCTVLPSHQYASATTRRPTAAKSSAMRTRRNRLTGIASRNVVALSSR